VKIAKLAILALVVGACATLYACGGDSGEVAMPPSQPKQTTQMLMTENVLSMAKTTSEVDDPIAVNDDAVSLTPTDDESSGPVSVDGQ
jgi:hypothetical protein